MVTAFVVCLGLLLLAALAVRMPAPRQKPKRRRLGRRPPPHDFPAAGDFGGFQPGRSYRTRSRRAWLIDGGAVDVRNPVRVSAANPRAQREHWLFEQATGRWFFVRGARGDDCCEVKEADVPDEVKDRAFACWCREQDRRKKGNGGAGGITAVPGQPG
jgi:hypothetical protein